METKVRIEMDLQISEKENIKDFIPFKAHENDAAYDIMAAENSELNPLETKLVSAGFRIQLEKGYEAQIRPRSGLAIKNGITVLNTPGTIDADYRGEVKIILVNLSDTDFTINSGERVAQIVFAKCEQMEVVNVETLSETERGAGGFGHTGK